MALWEWDDNLEQRFARRRPMTPDTRQRTRSAVTPAFMCPWQPSSLGALGLAAQQPPLPTTLWWLQGQA